MLGLHVKFGVSELTMIWMLLVFIATLGGAYAIFGGSKRLQSVTRLMVPGS